MRAASVALLLAACSVPEPANDEVAAPELAGEAIELAVALWGEELDLALSPEDVPPVRWFAGECLEYEGEGDRCSHGAYWSGGLLAEEIHVLWTERPSDGALVHELLHWALGGDSDHEGPEWGSVTKIRTAIRTSGL